MKSLVVLPKRERGVCCEVTLELPAAKALEIAGVLKALGDPTRLQIILALRAAKEPICICDFTESFALSQPTISHHMARLHAVGLVEATKRGIWVYYQLRRHFPNSVDAVINALAS